VATDDEIVDGISLLARTEGIWTETAGGVTVSVARKLINDGVIPRDESIVLCITGNGLKTQEAVAGKIGRTVPIAASLASLQEALAEIESVERTGKASKADAEKWVSVGI
jgi:threonine synthase